MQTDLQTTNAASQMHDPLEFAAALSRSFAQTQDINATVREALAQIVGLLKMLDGLSRDELDALFRATAWRFYRLG